MILFWEQIESRQDFPDCGNSLQGLEEGFPLVSIIEDTAPGGSDCSDSVINSVGLHGEELSGSSSVSFAQVSRNYFKAKKGIIYLYVLSL